MRLFTAIDLPDDIKDYLFELENKFSSNKAAKIKWVFRKNLHLTIKFFGEVPDDKAQELIEKLKNVKFKKFGLKLADFGFYSSHGKTGVIWAGAEPAEKVAELQKLVDAETIGLGDLKIGAHITIGRVKFVKNKEGFARFAEEVNSFKIEKLSFDVDRFCIFRSILRKDGPEYNLLKSYELG